FLSRLGTAAAAKRDLIEALSGAGIDVKMSAEAEKAEVDEAVQDLLDRAQKLGQVRSDVQLADLFGLVVGTCAFAGHDMSECSQARMLEVVYDGLRPQAPASTRSPGSTKPPRD
ncbi:MAG: hypothetical protein JO337_09845, partial [Acidimicrobiales bacterium]|nr:hypothetical protein [Acidimicrobiales bacterium]